MEPGDSRSYIIYRSSLLHCLISSFSVFLSSFYTPPNPFSSALIIPPSLHSVLLSLHPSSFHSNMLISPCLHSIFTPLTSFHPKPHLLPPSLPPQPLPPSSTPPSLLTNTLYTCTHAEEEIRYWSPTVGTVNLRGQEWGVSGHVTECLKLPTGRGAKKKPGCTGIHNIEISLPLQGEGIPSSSCLIRTASAHYTLGEGIPSSIRAWVQG